MRGGKMEYPTRASFKNILMSREKENTENARCAARLECTSAREKSRENTAKKSICSWGRNTKKMESSCGMWKLRKRGHWASLRGTMDRRCTMPQKNFLE